MLPEDGDLNVTDNCQIFTSVWLNCKPGKSFKSNQDQINFPLSKNSTLNLCVPSPVVIAEVVENVELCQMGFIRDPSHKDGIQ